MSKAVWTVTFPECETEFPCTPPIVISYSMFDGNPDGQPFSAHFVEKAYKKVTPINSMTPKK